MYNKLICFLFSLFIGGCSSGLNSSESWIEYNDVSNIKIGMGIDSVISTLGEPILILADTEYNNTDYVFYNYHIKRYKLYEGKINSDSRVNSGERVTLLKFTFIDGSLTAWEEEKMTLSMAIPKDAATGSYLKYFSLLVNLIVLIKIF